MPTVRQRLVPIAVAALATLAVGAPGSSASSGPSPAQLQLAGWTCFNPPVDVNRYVHCAPPGTWEATVTRHTPSARLMTFDTFDVDATDASLLGTERMIRSDLYAGQPCPTDPPSGEYTSLDIDPFNLDYLICHTFDSPW